MVPPTPGRGPMRWLATGFLLVLVLVGLALAAWQWQRAGEKEAIAQRLSSALADAPVPLQALTDASLADRQSVLLAGTYLWQATIYLDNRAMDGAAGVHVLTPLQLKDGRIAWVNRGWMPKAPGLADPRVDDFVAGRRGVPSAAFIQNTPALNTPNLNVPTQDMATALRDPLRRMALGVETPQGALWQNMPADWGRDWLANRAQGSASAPPDIFRAIFWLQPTSTTAPKPTDHGKDGSDEPLRLRPALPDNAADTHRAYALQWVLMSVAAGVFAFRLRPSRR